MRDEVTVRERLQRVVNENARTMASGSPFPFSVSYG
jgi:hypothetical protein